MAERYDEQYRDRGQRRDDRGFMERAGDEVRSWFGDDDAERRRQSEDPRDRDRFRERQYGQSGEYSGRNDRAAYDRPYDRSHDRSSSYPTGEQEWDRTRGAGSHGRDSGWRGSNPGQGGGWGSGSSWVYGPGTRYDQGTGYGSGSAYGPGYNPNQSEGYGQRSGGSFGGEDWRRDLGSRSESRGGFAGRGPKGYQRSDQRIQEDVCDRLCENPDIDASEIEVSVNNGEVTLSGSVSDRGEKRRAEDLVESISGVREVSNNLRVARGQDATISGRSGATSGAGASMGASGSGGGASVSSQPGITGGGPSGATDISTTTGASTPGSTLGLTGAPDKASTAGGKR